MAILISDLKIKLSGGLTTTNPLLSLGGVMSTDPAGEVISQTTTAPVNVVGVTIDNAYGNEVGAGILTWNNTTLELSWQPFAAAQATATIIVDTGTTPTVYVLGNSGGYLVVTVIYSSLALAIVQDADIVVNNKMSNVFDAVTAAQATAGLVEYRCLYLFNAGTSSAFDVRLWVKQQPVGPDDIDIALENPVVPGNGTTTGIALGPILDEIDSTNILDAAITAATLNPWSRPSTQATGLLLGTLAAGEGVAFWEKRTVYPETIQQVSNDTSKIGISALL